MGSRWDRWDRSTAVLSAWVQEDCPSMAVPWLQRDDMATLGAPNLLKSSPVQLPLTPVAGDVPLAGFPIWIYHESHQPQRQEFHSLAPSELINAGGMTCFLMPDPPLDKSGLDWMVKSQGISWWNSGVFMVLASLGDPPSCCSRVQSSMKLRGKPCHWSPRILHRSPAN